MIDTETAKLKSGSMKIRYPVDKAPKTAHHFVITSRGQFMAFDSKPELSNLSSDGWVSWEGGAYLINEYVPPEWRKMWRESHQELA